MMPASIPFSPFVGSLHVIAAKLLIIHDRVIFIDMKERNKKGV
jgi:hypothetical protein